MVAGLSRSECQAGLQAFNPKGPGRAARGAGGPGFFGKHIYRSSNPGPKRHTTRFHLKVSSRLCRRSWQLVPVAYSSYYRDVRPVRLLKTDPGPTLPVGLKAPRAPCWCCKCCLELPPWLQTLTRSLSGRLLIDPMDHWQNADREAKNSLSGRPYTVARGRCAQRKGLFVHVCSGGS